MAHEPSCQSEVTELSGRITELHIDLSLLRSQLETCELADNMRLRQAARLELLQSLAMSS